jgi:HrpA-like RNA helicase
MRRDLKLVLMSATLHCQIFVDFFGNPPIIRVAGRLFPVSVFYLDEPESDCVDACAIAIIQLNIDLPAPGDILVFVTGQEEIEDLIQLLRSKSVTPPLHILPLYAALPMSEQQLIFEPGPPNTRKVILATNIAETSVTIPGVKYVIDCGLVKLKSFNPMTGVEVLCSSAIAKAQAMQRSGRAGRESSGACFRLYTEEDFLKLADSPISEIRRADLTGILLQLFALGVENPLKFPFLERPRTELMRASLDMLYQLGGIDDSGTLTEDGHSMAKFPLTPRMSKLLLTAFSNKCGRSAIVLVAMMSCENLFVMPKELRAKARKQHELFSDGTGDHVALVRVCEAFVEAEDKHKFCMKHFLNQRALDYALNIRDQLMDTARQIADLDEEDEEGRFDRLRMCLKDCWHENVARHVVGGEYECVEDGVKVWIHPSSFLFSKGKEWIAFSERVKTKRLYARWVSEVEGPELAASECA